MKTSGPVANDLQNVMAEIVARYKAGDLTMIKEIIRNSEKTDPVTMAMKAALAAEKSKKRRAGEAGDDEEGLPLMKITKLMEGFQGLVNIITQQQEQIKGLTKKMDELSTMMVNLIEPAEPVYNTSQSFNNENTIFNIAKNNHLLDDMPPDAQQKIRAEVGKQLCDYNNPRRVTPVGTVNGINVYDTKDNVKIVARIAMVKQQYMEGFL